VEKSEYFLKEKTSELISFGGVVDERRVGVKERILLQNALSTR
jgi:hypothetical protein